MASTPSPSVLASIVVPPASVMMRRSSVSRSRAFARKAASPTRSVSAVESAISAKRMTAVPELAGARRCVLLKVRSSERNCSTTSAAVISPSLMIASCEFGIPRASSRAN